MVRKTFVLFMIDAIVSYRQRLYTLGRLIAVVVIAPVLLYRGNKYHDGWLMAIGVLLLVWDGIKLLIQFANKTWSEC